jgi:hypothetical protein
MISHQRPFSIIYDILSLTNSTLLTADTILLCTKMAMARPYFGHKTGLFLSVAKSTSEERNAVTNPCHGNRTNDGDVQFSKVLGFCDHGKSFPCFLNIKLCPPHNFVKKVSYSI